MSVCFNSSNFAMRRWLFLLIVIASTLHGADAPKTRNKSASPSAAKKEKEKPPEDLTTTRVAARARDSVVVISHFGREGKSDGLGTGFVISSNGLIATSLHVIGEGRPITLETTDGRHPEVVEIYAWNRHYDLAVLRVKGSLPPPIPLGDSDLLKQGEEVVAIGNPLGLEHSVVHGVVSARREIEGVDMIQVAIPIEPGNSGGPLLDMSGRLQGVIALKSAMTANLGFAVPVNALKRLMDRPTPVPMDRWLNIGALDPAEWETLMGSRWRQKVDRIVAEGLGDGFGGRSLCLSKAAGPKVPFEIAVTVKLDDEAGAAGIAFGADGGDKHFGFYPTAGQLRLTRFDGSNVFAWKILQQGSSDYYLKGDWNRIKVRVEADRIQCFVNGHAVFESNEAELAGSRIGLCKFRNTQAEFKELKVGPAVDGAVSEFPPALLTDLQNYLQTPTPDKESKLASSFGEQRESATRYLNERARQLEKDATILKRLAQNSHVRQVGAELKEILTASEKEIDLVHAALLVARLDDPSLDVEAYRAHFRRMAKQLKTSVPETADTETKLRALKRYFFQDEGYHGSQHDYYERANSYLNQVMENREGIPITLSLLYLELGHELGLTTLRPHPLPGHFAVAYKRTDGSERVIDVFEGGRELTHAEADLLTAGTSEREILSELIEPARKREIVVRMLRNLLGVAQKEELSTASLKYLDLILTLQPNSPMDRLDRARLRALMKDVTGAKEDIQWLLDHSPKGFDPDRLEELLRSL